MMRILRLFSACLVFSLFASGQIRLQVSFPAGSAVSQEVRIDSRATGLRSGTAVAISLPSGWSGQELILETSIDGESDWQPVFDSDDQRIRIRVGPARVVVLDPSAFWGLQRIRFIVVAPNSETPDPHPAERTFRLILR